MDLETMVKAMSLKSLKNINFLQPANRHAVLVSWIRDCFGFASYGNIFTILDCRFTQPIRRKWRGSPFYLESFRCLSSLVSEPVNDSEALLSTPIWHNKALKTKSKSSTPAMR